MINPTKISNFHLTSNGLEEHICFWIAVANKNADTTSKYLDKFFLELSKQSGPFFDADLNSPFELIRNAGTLQQVTELVKNNKFGCFNIKARSFIDVANSGLDLKTCSVQQLENIHGIGPKTARCFIIHTRPNARHAGLDTHILRFMRDAGLNAPHSTPVGKKYEYWENKFLELVPEDTSIAEFDLAVWNLYKDSN